MVRFFFARERSLRSVHCGAWTVDGGFGLGKMALADADAVEGAFRYFFTDRIGPGLRAEVVFEILPVVAALVIGAERAAGIVAAMDHAVLAAWIARNTVDDAVFFPLHFREHLLVAVVMAVGHQVARRFPAFDVVCRNRPGGAGQFAFAGEKFLIHRRAEDGELLAPLLNLGEFLPCHLAREEEVLRLFA